MSLRSRLLASGGAAGGLALIGALVVWGLSSAPGAADADDHVGAGAVDAELLRTDPPVSRADEVLDDPATWVISDGSVGAVRIGGDFVATLDELPAEWGVADACGDVATWDSSVFDVTFSSGMATGGIATIAVAGGLGEPSSGPRTPDGLGLGSTRDEVKAVYPRAEEVPGDGDGIAFLRPADEDLQNGSVYFQLSTETDRVVAIILTSGAVPDTDPCP